MKEGCDALFLGDSITCDSNFDEFFPELRIVNLGVYGDTLEDLLRRVPEVRTENPAKIFLMGGINSLVGLGVNECQRQYAELVAALREACPNAALYLQSVLPVSAEQEALCDFSNQTVRALNDGIRAIADQQSLTYIDLWPAYAKSGALNPALTRDGVHLNFNAYGPWADRIRPILMS